MAIFQAVMDVSLENDTTSSLVAEFSRKSEMSLGLNFRPRLAAICLTLSATTQAGIRSLRLGKRSRRRVRIRGASLSPQIALVSKHSGTVSCNIGLLKVLDSGPSRLLKPERPLSPVNLQGCNTDVHLAARSDVGWPSQTVLCSRLA